MIEPLNGARRLRVYASDQFPLSARYFPSLTTSPTETQRIVIFLCGVGASQHRFQDLANYCTQAGWHALTFDYRGIGESAIPPGMEPDVSMQAWGELDLTAMIKWADSELENPHIALLGHSMGGQIAALADNAQRVSAMLMIGCQKGYWRLWPDWRRYLVYGVFRLAVPTCLATFGHVPLRWIGLHRLEPGIAADYARWTLRPDYRSAQGRLLTPAYYCFTAPILSISFDDDVIYAPKPTVDALVNRFYVKAAVVRAHLIAQEYSALGFGHAGFFQSHRCPQALWRDCIEWLTHVTAGGAPHGFVFSALPTYPLR
ncbi:alpha/beta fold hydrolase [Pseudomonas sp.]|uniref:alpha/beta hydrolase family protein n=1 Tax=Pseudomonas sp. TaxID=306 RepID=UPI0023542B7A|nr:alpha/beta fold hydrolase [Pseudomonas sp.]